MHVVEAGEAILVFERIAGGQRLRCSFNLSDSPVPFQAAGKALIRVGDVDAAALGTYAAVVEEIA
jgi:hypothetical protein